MALFLPRFNLVFIHIYKNAGTAIRTALQQEDRGYKEIGRGHADYKEVAELLDLYKKSTFSVVRNPYDWVYSVYQYAKTYESHPFHSYCLENNFSQFVNWYFDNKEEFEKLVNGKLQCQTDYVTGEDGLIKVDFILKIENLQQEFNNMFDVLRYRHVNLGNENTTKKGEWKEGITPDAINRINYEYMKDFRNFNYKMI